MDAATTMSIVWQSRLAGLNLERQHQGLLGGTAHDQFLWWLSHVVQGEAREKFGFPPFAVMSKVISFQVLILMSEMLPPKVAELYFPSAIPKPKALLNLVRNLVRMEMPVWAWVIMVAIELGSCMAKELTEISPLAGHLKLRYHGRLRDLESILRAQYQKFGCPAYQFCLPDEYPDRVKCWLFQPTRLSFNNEYLVVFCPPQLN